MSTLFSLYSLLLKILNFKFRNKIFIQNQRNIILTDVLGFQITVYILASLENYKIHKNKLLKQTKGEKNQLYQYFLNVIRVCKINSDN